MLEHSFVFDIHYKIENDGARFESNLYCVTMGKHIGEITGDIKPLDGKKVFQIDTSDVDKEFRGIGLGYKFYIETIKKSFDYGAGEFRSSECLNEMSTGLWNSILRKNHNVEKLKKYYTVKRDKNFI